MFVLKKSHADEKNTFAENKFIQDKLVNTIKLLRSRKRTVKLFYETEVLKVYEIVNEPRESKISDLIF